MISIKKFLALDTEGEQTLMHVVRLLVEGIGRHAVTGDAEETARFRKSIEEASESLQADIAPAELLVRAGAVVQSLEDHSARTGRDQLARTTELQNMVKMLTATVGAISAAGSNSISRLGEIEQQVTKISALDDIRTIKARLGDCLSDIRKEAQRQQRETGATIEQLTGGLAEARKHSGASVAAAVPGDGSVVGARAEAETALAEPVRQDGQTFAAVFVLERLQAINRRFGTDIGDEILAEFVRLIRKNLPSPDDRLYRWGGPTLLALMSRPVIQERVRNEIARMMETKWEHNIQMSSRTIMLPITTRWTVLPLMAAPRLLYRKIDVFAAAPSPND